jgi:D-xylose 1-dehydrogenase (NADP+, D-xylono-1,5-lactone-forming)
MTGPVRWGFLGAGFVATKGVAPALHAARGAVLQVVGARDLGRAEALEPVRATTSYEEVCTADDVDAIYISLPNDVHLAWVERALSEGKHVLCEKPLGMSADEVAHMAGASERSGRLLVEAAWNRWHPRTRRAEELLAGLPGPRDVRAWFTFPGVPDGNYRLEPGRGGGALLDVGCYGVGLALAAIGPGPATVAGAEHHVGPTGVDLTTVALLGGAAGQAEVRASFEEGESQGFEVAAPGASLELSRPAFTSWREASSLRLVADGVEHVERFTPVDPYQVMLESVSARVRGEDGWVLPLEVSRAVATVLDEIARLARAGSAAGPSGPLP